MKCTTIGTVLAANTFMYIAAFHYLFAERQLLDDLKVALSEPPNDSHDHGKFGSVPSAEASNEFLGGNTQVVVISSSLPPANSSSKAVEWNYVFYLPMAAMTWLAFHSSVLVILVGPRERWLARAPSQLVLRTLESLGPRVKPFFLHDTITEKTTDHDTMLSQVSRLYGSPILKELGLIPPGMENKVWVTTTDVDLLPATGMAPKLAAVTHGAMVHIMEDGNWYDNFTLPFKGVKITPSMAAGTYRMHAMAYITMTIHGWSTVMGLGSVKGPVTPSMIIQEMERTFGEIALRKVKQAQGDSWFFDQCYLSMKIGQFLTNGTVDEDQYKHKLRFVPRDTGVDRFDRSYWSWRKNYLGFGRKASSLEQLIDAHLPRMGFLPMPWKETIKFLFSVFGKELAEVMRDYRSEFVKALGSAGSR